MGADPELADLAAVVLVPFPAQGHVTPMLHLARALAARGVASTVAVPDFVHRRMGSCADVASGGVGLASIPSGIFDDGGEPPGFASIAHAMEHHMPAHLERMLTRGHAACVVVDVLASWAIPVASRCGVPAVGFWPAMLASFRVVAAIPELLRRRFISDSGIPILTDGFDKDQENADLRTANNLHILPEELQLGTKELLPWLVGCTASQEKRFAFWLQILQRTRNLRCLLVNSFPSEAADEDSDQLHASQGLQILHVGPLSIHGLLENSLKLPGKNPSMWQADGSCMDWLDQQRPGSVIYVSFGSWVAPIGSDEISELALGLEATGRPFLWVLKNDPSWRAGLPAGYLETVTGRGKVVAWAPQGGVLAHEAVGCYLTHCGWNSTLEAIQHGVRLLCYPVSGDQFINSAFIVKMWETGIRLRSTRRCDVKDGIGRIMEGDDGRRLQQKMYELRERVMAGEARFVAKRNLEAFVDGIKRDDLPFHQLAAKVYTPPSQIVVPA
ncbi:UDP-glycosyltransferase 82A1 [Lolium perenne]|uniref:UDP-glycosyltransferase 82A1 n=1 Tax=Lolium perenne TaxID=4522 RepID=UPI0021EA377F|nr:UDP-glycosyltransferase 82A1-like [Lolium perenne]